MAVGQIFDGRAACELQIDDVVLTGLRTPARKMRQAPIEPAATAQEQYQRKQKNSHICNPPERKYEGIAVGERVARIKRAQERSLKSVRP